MSMNDFAQRDSFWDRVRALLQRTPAGRSSAFAAIGRQAAQTGPLEEELRRAWSIAAERQIGLCVMAVEIDCFTDYLAAYGRDAAEDCLETLDQAIGAVLGRPEFRCLRVGQSGFVLVLPDLPLRTARGLAGKIMAAVRHEGLVNKESHAGVVTVGAGLAVIDPVAGFDYSVLDAARHAVRKAQRHGLSRLDAIDLNTAEERQSKAA
ncbi:MAG: diguanylate cyclase [Devosia sp.]|nr:diguanylate cyclase [Devosia sp.]